MFFSANISFKMWKQFGSLIGDKPLPFLALSDILFHEAFRFAYFFLSLSLLVSSILYSKILPNFYLKWSSSFFFLKLGSIKACSKAIFIWENTLLLAASLTQVFLMKLQTQCRHRPRLWILPIHCLFSHWLLK